MGKIDVDVNVYFFYLILYLFLKIYDIQLNTFSLGFCHDYPGVGFRSTEQQMNRFLFPIFSPFP